MTLGQARERLKAAIAAGRGRIVRQVLKESVMLSLAGAITGTALGMAGIRWLLVRCEG